MKNPSQNLSWLQPWSLFWELPSLQISLVSMSYLELLFAVLSSLRTVPLQVHHSHALSPLHKFCALQLPCLVQISFHANPLFVDLSNKVLFLSGSCYLILRVLVPSVRSLLVARAADRDADREGGRLCEHSLPAIIFCFFRP